MRSTQNSNNMNQENPPLLSIRDLHVAFRTSRIERNKRKELFEAVKGIHFDIPENATVGLVGESGSGKSVTALAILGLLPPENALILPGSRIIYGGHNLIDLPQSALRELRGKEMCRLPVPAFRRSTAARHDRHGNRL